MQIAFDKVSVDIEKKKTMARAQPIRIKNPTR